MLRPRAQTGFMPTWLCCVVLVMSVSGSEALSEAELDATLHAKDPQPLSAAFLTKLREQRPPLWHSGDTIAANLSASASREKLHLISIERDFDFGPPGIKKWISLENMHTVYVLGLAERSITLVTTHPPKPALRGMEKSYQYTSVTRDIPDTVIAASTFKVHHPENSTTHVYAVVAWGATSTSLTWYRIGNDSLEEVWTQQTKESVNDIATAELSAEHFILILNTCTVTHASTECRPSVDIYHFNSWSITNIKLSQPISFEAPAGPVSVGFIGDEVLLAIPVLALGKVFLYRLVRPSKLNEIGDEIENLYGYFKQYDSIDSKEVTQAIFFQQNYKTFLAVSGLSPVVYRIDDELERTGCLFRLKKWGKVLHWVAVPIPNYRQDVVLLAQHEITPTPEREGYYGVAPFTYNDGTLQYQRDTRCYVSKNESPQEGSAACLLLFGNPNGIDGTAVLPLGGSSAVFLLVPNKATSSSFVGIFTKLIEATNPVIRALDSLNDERRQLETVMAAQESAIHESEVTLLDVLQTEGPGVITGPWTVNELTSSLVEVEDVSSIKEPKMVGKSLSENWTKADLKVDLAEVTNRHDRLERVVKSINEDLQGAVLRSEDGFIELEGLLTVFGGLEIASESKFEFLTTKLLNGEPLQELLEDAVRLDSLREITSHKNVSSLHTDNVVFSSANNIPASRLVFDSGSDLPITIDGSLHFNNGLETEKVLLTAGGKVNGIDIAQELFVPVPFKPLPVHSITFEEIVVQDVKAKLVNRVPLTRDSYYTHTTWGVDQKLNGGVLNSVKVDGKVFIEYVNEMPWGEFLNGLVWTDQPSTIPGTVNISQIVLKTGADVALLDGLPFPEAFVVSTRPEHVITGQKTFKSGLYAADVTVTSINDVSPNSIVTLISDQNLPGALTLSNAYVGTDIKVNSKLNGVSIQAINTPSPTLPDGGVISANMYFNELQVDGSIVVSNSLGDSLITDIISDILVIPDPLSPEAAQPIVITGDKTLPFLATSSLTVSSGLLNGLPINGFVTTNTKQVFNNHVVSSNYIEFGNVHLNGLWDGVDVVKLKNNVVTLSGNQKTSAHLTYADTFELWASRLNINELNDHLTDDSVSVVFPGLPHKEYDVQLSENGEVIVDGSLGATNIGVGGNVIVKGKVCGVNLLEFDRNRLSLSKPQTISSDMKIDNLEVNQLFNLTSTNNIPSMSLNLTYATPPADLEAGSYTLDVLEVKGDIIATFGVNGFRVDKIAADAIQLDTMNTIEGNLVFLEPVYFGALEVHNGVNGLDLAQIEADAIFKGQDVVLKGHTTVESLIIQGHLATNNLLNLNPANLLMKDREQVIESLRVSGDLYVTGEVAVDKAFNGKDIKKITGRYKKLGKGRHQIIGDLNMSGDVVAEDFSVRGNVNGKDLPKFLASTVDKFEDNGLPISGNIVITGQLTFAKPVTVEGTVNGISLADYYKNVVLVNGTNAEIASKVIFESTLSASEVFTVDNLVEAKTIYGCNVTDWFYDCIFIDENTTFQGERSFDDVIAKSLNTSMLNALDMGKVILLNETQTVEVDLSFTEITSNRLIEIQHLINGIDVEAAFHNTLLTHVDQVMRKQEIFGKTFTGPVIVQGNLNVLGLINGIDVTKAVILNGDKVIASPLVFQGPVIAKSNVYVDGPISANNVTNWSENVLLTDSSLVQDIYLTWDIQGKVTFLENAMGIGRLNSIDVKLLEAMKTDVHDQIVAIRANLTDKWTKMCFEVKSLTEAARKQPFLLRQIDVVQSIESHLYINSIHIFKVPRRTLLFVSYLYSCSGALYEWNATSTQWILVSPDVPNAGGISKWLTVPSSEGGPTYLVTSAEYNGLNCLNYGGRVWKFNRGLKLVKEIKPWIYGKVNPEKSEFYLMNENKLTIYGIQGGKVEEKYSRTLTSADRSYLTSRSFDDSLMWRDGSVVGSLENTALSNPDKFVASLWNGANQGGHIAMFGMPDGRRFAALFEEQSRSVMIHNLDMQLVVGRISTRNARWITPLELGDNLHPGQTYIAFIEGHNVLRVLQYKGEQGFVTVARIELPIDVVGLVFVSIPARGLLRDPAYLVVRGRDEVLMLEVEMLGDPLPDESPTCTRNTGF